MRLHVLINSGAGSVGDLQGTVSSIQDAFAHASEQAEHDVSVTVDDVAPDRLADAVVSAWTGGFDAVVIAGGDGTVNAAAAAAVDTDIVLSVLPLGTFNHFAGDLGIAGDLRSAATAIVNGEVRSVDVGEVNGEVFVNNSVIGVYPTMVAARDRIQDDKGWGKLRAVPVAAVKVLRDLPLHRLDLDGSGGYSRRRVRTPFVFVGNGIYDNAKGGTMARSTIEDGVLGVSVARVVTRWGLVRAAVGTLFRGAGQARDLDHVSLEELTIRSRTRHLRVARDGEVQTMKLPLRYTCRPLALKVLAPPVEVSPSR